MGNRLPHGLGRCGHWLDMLGVDEAGGQCERGEGSLMSRVGGVSSALIIDGR